MSKKPTSLRDKITRLRNTFVSQLPERLTDARRLYASLHADPGASEAATALHRNLHGIHGTGASFGFRELSILAKQGENLVSAIMEHPTEVAPADWCKLAECLTELEQLIKSPDFQIESGHISEQSTDNLALSKPSVLASSLNSERRVYICDDDPLTAAQLGEQLRCFGYRVSLYSRTSDLRQAVIAAPPDAVIMDIVFPEGACEGTDILTELRENNGIKFPAVFVSGRHDFDARLRAIRAGGEAYFPKPVKAMELVACLDMLIQQVQPEPFKVLIVDDELEIAEYHRLILEAAGMITQVMRAPETILTVLDRFKPDLVLMDIYMPDCSGHEVAKLIRQIPEFVSLPIVFLSGETDTKKQFSAMDIGADGFLTKPIQPEDLVTAVALRAERMRILRSLMTRDSLTGLFNHTTTTQLLESAVSTAQRQQNPLSFAMIDLDHFKSVNDRYGHPTGDQVLLALAQVLNQRLRNSDLVGRYGGEEFAVILHNTAPNEAAQVMEQLRQDFGSILFHAGDTRFSCTFSCGIACVPVFDSMESLREAADKALYQAKFAGRNRVVALSSASIQ